MTKKRYIKLLMSLGYSRNRAREKASCVVQIQKEHEHINEHYKMKHLKDSKFPNSRLTLRGYYGNYYNNLPYHKEALILEQREKYGFVCCEDCLHDSSCENKPTNDIGCYGGIRA